MRNIAISLSLFSSLLLSACTVGQKVGADQYQSFQEGKTTRADIVAALGEPNGITWAGQDETLSYSFVASDKRGYIPVVGAILLAVDGVKSEVQVCGFTVDSRKVLKVKTCSGSAQKVGGLSH